MSDLFRYRKYSRYPLERRRKQWRVTHDTWAWFFVLAMIAMFVALEFVR